jgi:hypothetical protein
MVEQHACPTCEKDGFVRCEWAKTYDVQSGYIRCNNKAEYYMKTTMKDFGIQTTTYLCTTHYKMTKDDTNR